MSQSVVEFHVALHGNDAWDGVSAVPRGNGVGPVASLQRAQDLVRALKAANGGHLPAAVRVLIHPGCHELMQPLVLTPEDSGSVDCPVVWTGTQGGQAVLSGGSRITGWVRSECAGRPAWRTTVPAVGETPWRFQQLFVNGARRSRPVLPKEGYYRFAGAPEGQHGFWHRVGTGQVRAGDVPELARPDEVELITYQLWFTNHLRIANLDRTTNVVTFKAKGWHTLYDSDQQLCRYRLVNVKEALSAPGEWYLDQDTSDLTYLPTAFEEALGPIVPAEFVAPRLESLLRLEGSQEIGGAKVAHVRFEQLSFQHAGWELPVANPGAIQSAFTVPGAIQVRGAIDCAFYACEISHVGQYGIEIQRGSHRIRIVACHLHDLGAGGIKINHESGLTAHRETNDEAFDGLDPVAMGWGALHRDGGGFPRPGIDASPGGFHSISDCHIHHGGAVYPSACGIWIGDSGYNEVLFNHIHHLHYTGISVGWNWNYAPPMRWPTASRATTSTTSPAAISCTISRPSICWVVSPAL